MAAYYQVKKRKDGSAVVESSNINAKEVFFGWGSDRNAVEGSFYGKQTGSWRGDRTRWRWDLTKEAVGQILSDLERTIDDSYYRGKQPHQRAEKKAAQELIKKLRG